VRIARTSAKFSSIEQAATCLKACDVAFSELNISKLSLLLDWRLAPLSTDPHLHRFLVRSTDVFAARFARSVATPLGKLQSVRVGRAHSTAAPVVFDDEARALEYLVGR
jgi:hypothetical protein